jgi:hypothetical protein
MICHSLGISRKGLLTSWVASTYYGKGMRQYVEEYYRACGVCQDSRVLRGKIQGELQPLEAPTEQLADTSIREIACFHGLQARVASDRGSVSPTSFGGTCCTHFEISRDMSTGIPFTERRSD